MDNTKLTNKMKVKQWGRGVEIKKKEKSEGGLKNEERKKEREGVTGVGARGESVLRIGKVEWKDKTKKMKSVWYK